ncbi:biotin-dependent carboxyltransferase family protein [Alteromonas sp. D210916BOD_24]
MDSDAYNWANFLACNLDNTPCIEAIGDMRLTVDSDCAIAVTGREATLSVNGESRRVYQTQYIKAGDEITFGSALFGAKAYLAICGNWYVPRAVGSACIVVRERLGGLDSKGSALETGNCFEINANDLQQRMGHPRTLPPQCQFTYGFDAPIHVTPGYQFDNFSEVAKRIFETSPYTVSPSIDRMGFRLNGAPISSHISQMRSEAIHIGAIQVPPDGQPIVMMRDRQTLGGYPKLGCVSPLDLDRLAQAVPGETVTFTFQNDEAARAEWLLATSRRRRLQGEIM